MFGVEASPENQTKKQSDNGYLISNMLQLVISLIREKKSVSLHTKDVRPSMWKLKNVRSKREQK